MQTLPEDRDRGLPPKYGTACEIHIETGNEEVEAQNVVVYYPSVICIMQNVPAFSKLLSSPTHAAAECTRGFGVVIVGCVWELYYERIVVRGVPCKDAAVFCAGVPSLTYPRPGLRVSVALCGTGGLSVSLSLSHGASGDSEVVSPA